MNTFVQFRETNDSEGESWNFWLQRDGNEDALASFARALAIDESDEESGDYPYVLDLGEILNEQQVDLLVDYAESGYYANHNKVTGTMVLPELLTLGDTNDLHKGGVLDLFKSE